MTHPVVNYIKLSKHINLFEPSIKYAMLLSIVKTGHRYGKSIIVPQNAKCMVALYTPSVIMYNGEQTFACRQDEHYVTFFENIYIHMIPINNKERFEYIFKNYKGDSMDKIRWVNLSEEFDNIEPSTPMPMPVRISINMNNQRNLELSEEPRDGGRYESDSSDEEPGDRVPYESDSSDEEPGDRIRYDCNGDPIEE
jgi:hypothetical protein